MICQFWSDSNKTKLVQAAAKQQSVLYNTSDHNRLMICHKLPKIGQWANYILPCKKRDIPYYTIDHWQSSKWNLFWNTIWHLNHNRFEFVSKLNLRFQLSVSLFAPPSPTPHIHQKALLTLRWREWGKSMFQQMTASESSTSTTDGTLVVSTVVMCQLGLSLSPYAFFFSGKVFNFSPCLFG